MVRVVERAFKSILWRDSYMNVGWKGGRNPFTHFSTTKYLAVYSGVQTAGVDPLQHFLTSGLIERPSSLGDRVRPN